MFTVQKTMYGGKHIAKGDTVFIFASENDGGRGLIVRGAVTSSRAIPKKGGVARQTPRVSIAVKRTALAKRPLGRSKLKQFTDWNDGLPETELNFKFYRQAKNKIVGISDETAGFLDGFFQRDHNCSSLLARKFCRELSKCYVFRRKRRFSTQYIRAPVLYPYRDKSSGKKTPDSAPDETVSLR